MVALVLLPGLDGTGRLLADFAAAFGPTVEVIIATYPPDRPLDYAGLEPIARSFLPPDRPYFLLAESFSGPLGIAIAAAPPPGLLGLILCSSFARNPVPLAGFLRPALDWLPLGRLPLGLLGFFLLGRFSSCRLRRALARALARVSPAVLRARIQAILAADVSGLLPDIRLPLLYLRASEDRIIPAAAAELVLSLAPQTRLVEFPAPHFLLQAQPLPVSSALTRYIDEMVRNIA
ncbi:MAG: hypothetical protein WAV95_20340 [Azonexus sp.]